MQFFFNNMKLEDLASSGPYIFLLLFQSNHCINNYSGDEEG